MLNTILFDLDGTLLNLDLDFFLQQYFKLLTPKLAQLIPPEKFVPEMLAATNTMIQNTDPNKTNQEVFLSDFTARVALAREQLMPLFDDFYENDFLSLQKYTKPIPAIRPIVVKAIEKGYDVVVATQPVFPYAAIKHRLDWAAVGDLPFKLVSSYESFHFCKPHPAYFQEILGKLGRQAEQCLMVGNDVDDDLPAGEIGIKTYLLTDCLLNRQGKKDFRVDYTGQMADLYLFVEELPKLK